MQQRYAERRSGMSYAFTRLLSSREARGLMKRHTRFDVQLQTPPVPEDDIALSSARRAALARVYNRVVRVPGLRDLALVIGAFFRIVGRKGESDQPAPAPEGAVTGNQRGSAAPA